LRDIGLSNYHEAETSVTSDDDYSDASTVIVNSHDSMSKGCRGFVKMAEVQIPWLLHAQMKMKLCKQKFVSG
jgi:hypothetical protein